MSSCLHDLLPLVIIKTICGQSRASMTEPHPADLHCANDVQYSKSFVTTGSCGFLEASFGEGGAAEGIRQQRTLPFESMQRVSSVVKDWILGMDDWPRGQCKLCRAERRPQGGEAERKWTWRSDQNIV